MILLSEIRDRVLSATNLYPEIQSYLTEVDEIISSAQDQIWNEQPWDFKIKDVHLNKYNDITSTDTNLTISIQHMTRNVSFSGIVGKLGFPFYHRKWQGQFIEIEGVDYPILKVASNALIFLAAPYKGADITAGTNWKIKARYDRLPVDCEKLLGYTNMDKPFVGITGGHYITEFGTPLTPTYYSHIRNDMTADYAEVIYRAPDLTIPAAGKIALSQASTANTYAFPTGKYYELCWSFIYAGKPGPLSESAIIRVNTGAFNTITATLTDNSGQAIQQPSYTEENIPYPHRYEGLEKVLWWNANTNPSATSEAAVRLGKPAWYPVIGYTDASGAQSDYRQITIADTTNTATLTALAQLTMSPTTNYSTGSYEPELKRYMVNNHKQIQCYPRVNRTDKSISTLTDPAQIEESLSIDIIHYYYKPEPMLLSNDPMTLPSAFTSLLVYKTLENLFIKLKDFNASMLYQNKYQVELRRLLNEFTGNDTRHLRLGRWGYDTVSSNPRFGNKVTIRG